VFICPVLDERPHPPCFVLGTGCQPLCADSEEGDIWQVEERVAAETHFS
jgi:hypothetical protein